jgi:hypothetical protein
MDDPSNIIMAPDGYPAVLPALMRLRDAGTDWHYSWLMQIDAIEFFLVETTAVYVNGVAHLGLCAAYKGYAMEEHLNGVLFVTGKAACALAQTHLKGLAHYPLKAYFDLSYWYLADDRVFYAAAGTIHKHLL